MMKIFMRLVCFSPMSFIGMPLFSFLIRVGYIQLEEKYMPIRPTDVFLQMALCGWTISCIIVSAIIAYIQAGIWIALVTLLITTLIILVLVKVMSKLILDWALKLQLESEEKSGK